MSIVESQNPAETYHVGLASRAGLVPYRLTVDDFLRMIDLGIFPKGAHMELLDGILFRRLKNGAAPSYRLRVDQYLRMIDLGFFPEKPDVELVGGILVQRMTKRRSHSYSVGKLDDLLRDILPDTWHVQAENPVVLDPASRPEPDIAVIRGIRDDYDIRDPVAADVGIIAESSESTYRKDRVAMWHRYVAARIPFYWIINLAACQVEVYSEPSGRGETAEYRVCRIYLEDQEIPVELGGVELGLIRVRDILPRTNPENSE